MRHGSRWGLAIVSMLAWTVLGAAGGLAAAPPGGEAERVLAAARAASGGAAWDAVRSLTLRARVKTSGLEGPLDSVADVRTGRYLDRYQLGPMAGAEGYDGVTPWSEDTGRQVQVQEARDAREAAANEAYRRAYAFWYPERHAATIESLGERTETETATGSTGSGSTGSARRFAVVRFVPDGGRAFEMWIDSASGLVDRTVEAGATETRTTFFSEYREVQGVKLPFALRSSNGDARYDQFITVSSAEINAPAAAQVSFAPPAPPPADFTLAAGRTSTELPFELINNHIYVRGLVNGQPLRLLCDTGGSNVLQPAVAKALGMKIEGALQGRGAGEASQDIGLAHAESLQVGDITLRSQLFAILDLPEAAEGIHFDGLIGYEVFKRFVVRIDYPGRKLTLTLPEAFAYQGPGVAVPFKIKESIPQVEGSIDGIAGVFDIDTGSRATLDLMTPFVEKNDLRRKLAPKIEGTNGWGVGGPARAQFVRARVLKLGDVAIAGPVVGLSLQTKGAFSDAYSAGNVGGGALRRFIVTFDYGHQRMYLERHAGSDQPDLFDRAGVWMNLADGAFQVIDVFHGGAAEAAGLMVGDRVLRVDGKTPAQQPLPDVRQLLRASPVGSTVELTIDRAGKKMSLRVTLRDLI